MVNRRAVLKEIGMLAAGCGLIPRWSWGDDKPPLISGLPSGVYDTAILDALPGKKPLIKLSYRPPNYETPLAYFKDAITPNDAFLFATTWP
jgi:hypothetical protein